MGPVRPASANRSPGSPDSCEPCRTGRYAAFVAPRWTTWRIIDSAHRGGGRVASGQGHRSVGSDRWPNRAGRTPGSWPHARRKTWICWDDGSPAATITADPDQIRTGRSRGRSPRSTSTAWSSAGPTADWVSEPNCWTGPGGRLGATMARWIRSQRLDDQPPACTTYYAAPGLRPGAVAASTTLVTRPGPASSGQRSTRPSPAAACSPSLPACCPAPAQRLAPAGPRG